MKGFSEVQYLTGNLFSSGLTYQLELSANVYSEMKGESFTHRKIKITDFAFSENLLSDAWVFIEIAVCMKNWVSQDPF